MFDLACMSPLALLIDILKQVAIDKIKYMQSKKADAGQTHIHRNLEDDENPENPVTDGSEDEQPLGFATVMEEDIRSVNG